VTDTRSRRLRGTGAGIAVPAASRQFRPYRRFGNPDWNPGKDIPPRTEKPKSTWRPPGISSRPEDAAGRRAEFARLRQEERLSAAEAGKRVGLTPATAAKYETRRKREAGGAA